MQKITLQAFGILVTLIFLSACSSSKNSQQTDLIQPIHWQKDSLAINGDDADWKSIPESYQITKFLVDAGTKLTIKLANGGGAAISIKPATEEDKGLKFYKQ